MHLHRLLLPFAIAVSLVAIGTEHAQADGGCAPTNVVFYSGDTVNLAQALHNNPSACADYWISITPTAAGGPRDQAALTTIHGFGPHFHALAELRPQQWTSYAATNGWFATGVKLHDDMVAVGYDPARDTWAVNEVGFPSTSSVSTDVFFGNDAARQNFRDLVRGLYSGSSGLPMPGLVFAADPAQYAGASDVSQYEQALAHWYGDAPFWQDMQRYVRFWAQETYADARSWGIGGAGLDERASRLNDYYLQGMRLAAAGGAAQAFLTSAYTPVGNATYRWPAPDPALGPAFGMTDIPIDAMLNFISAQTYALRTSTPVRFGFAINAKNSNATWNGQIYQRLAATIHDSESGPSAACTTGCDGTVDGAAFTDTWRNFATPPVVVPQVTGTLSASGWYTTDVTVGWSVSDPQTPIQSSTGCDTQAVTQDTAGTTFTCSATSSGGSTTVSVTIDRDATPPSLECTPTPATIWPPDGKPVPVKIDVTLADATSGAAAWALTDAPAGFVDLGTLPAVKGAVYTVTYSGLDVAGNRATCTATIVVPHDQGLHRGSFAE